MEQNLLVVQDLEKYFYIGRSFLFAKGHIIHAVDGVSFAVKKGQVFGLVGESGCGKTSAGRAILRLIEPTAGQVFFNGQEVTSATTKELKLLRRRMQFVFQDPYSSLDPRMSIYRTLREPLSNFFTHLSRRKIRDLVAEYLVRVGLEPDYMNRYPHEFSGGQRQRIALARALITEPELIICDEPFSALDVSIQAQVINLLKKLQRDFNLSLVLISHDLAVVEYLCDPIAVMYLGRIVEISPKATLYEKPLHPYTEALLSAVLVPDPYVEKDRYRALLSGDVPSLVGIPSGCGFHPRCPLAINACRKQRPQLVEVTPGRLVACIVRGASVEKQSAKYKD
jgi:oligopeptide/dipeptide ABC transporter ATP-binding protein